MILQRNGKQGVSDLDGKKIIQLEYDNIIITGNSINAQKGDEVTVFNSEGEKLKNSNFIDAWRNAINGIIAKAILKEFK